MLETLAESLASRMPALVFHFTFLLFFVTTPLTSLVVSLFPNFLINRNLPILVELPALFSWLWLTAGFWIIVPSLCLFCLCHSSGHALHLWLMRNLIPPIWVLFRSILLHNIMHLHACFESTILACFFPSRARHFIFCQTLCLHHCFELTILEHFLHSRVFYHH